MRLTAVLTRLLVLACAVTAIAAQSHPLQPAQPQARPPLTAEQQEAQRARQAASAPDAPRPIDVLDTVWIEEMTWMETRDALRAGKTTAIIGTGGLEQNGPYSPNGKHNYVLRATCEAIARTGNTPLAHYPRWLTILAQAAYRLTVPTAPKVS